MCRILVSSILTHAISLTLMADMCWFKVTAIVLYGGTMISDHGTASKPRFPEDRNLKEIMLGTHWYRGLWS